MIPDINVVVAASRADHVHHQPASDWLNEGIAADGDYGVEILPMVAAGFLRLVTNARVFAVPTPINRALDFIDAILRAPGGAIATSGQEWPELRELCGTHQLAGNDIPDAWIAATVRSLGGHLITFDTGFSRWLGNNELTILTTHQYRAS